MTNKFDKLFENFINENKTDDLGPQDIKKTKNEKLAVIKFKDGNFDEKIMNIEDVRDLLNKDYKWNGSVWVNKRDEDIYINISTQLGP